MMLLLKLNFLGQSCSVQNLLLSILFFTKSATNKKICLVKCLCSRNCIVFPHDDDGTLWKFALVGDKRRRGASFLCSRRRTKIVCGVEVFLNVSYYLRIFIFNQYCFLPLRWMPTVRSSGREDFGEGELNIIARNRAWCRTILREPSC
jgi:hypothetical protein